MDKNLDIFSSAKSAVSLKGYLGDKEIINRILDEFFNNIKSTMSSWRSGKTTQDLAQLEVESEVKRVSAIFAGVNPIYKPMEKWNGIPLAQWLKDNAEIEFPLPEDIANKEIDDTIAEIIIRAYITALTSMYMAAMAAEEAGKMDPGRWTDWLIALKRKMCFQLLGIPG